jgi:alkylation response protein AidB-like acyl-CoA dehydrogenase
MRGPAEDPSWFTAQHAKERARIREVLAREVAPHADDWEAQRNIGPAGWRAMGAAGLFDLPHAGEGFLLSALLLEELGSLGYAGVRAAIGVHAYMAASYIDRFAPAGLKQTYLPEIRAGRTVAALAMSEQNAGSDLSLLATRAGPSESGAVAGFRVNGRKLHVANGSRANVFVTLVRTGETAERTTGRGLAGMSLLLIDADAPGVTRDPEPMLGWRAADVCQVAFEDVFVPGDHLIGKPGRALMYIVQALDFERLAAGLLALGGAQHTMRILDERIREHRVRDVPLSGHQAVRHRVADLSAELAVVRQYGYHAAWLQSQGRLDTHAASVLKLKATELAREAAQACAQLHGASGYLEDSVVARLYRDAIAGTIAAGASELVRDLIFEAQPTRR